MRARQLLATAMALGLALGAGAAVGTAAASASGTAAVPLPGTATTSMTCDQILWEPVEIALADTASVFDESRMTDAGGLACTWIDIGQEFTLAYAPVDDEQRAAAVAELEAAGLERTDSPEGIRFHSAETEQAGPLDGDHLFADGHWYAVQALSVGSGGYFLVPGSAEATDGVRTRVLQAVGANTPSPTPTPPPAPTPASAAVPPPPEPTETPEPSLTADEPSVLSSLTPAGAAPVTVASVASTAGTALVLAALVAIPNRLVDMTAGALADRRRRRTASDAAAGAPGLAERIRRLIRRIERSLHPVAGIAIGLIAAGALTALIDPRAGATLGTLRLAASATLGFAIEGLLGLLVVAWLLRRDGASVAVRFRPVSLLIVLGAIVVTRVVGFEPGFVFGIVLALVFLRPSPKHEQRGALIELGYLAAVGVAAWLVYSALQASAPPTGPLGLLAVETLAGLTIACLMALPLLLSPVGELPGSAIWRRSRLLWVAAFAVAMALVVWVVMPFPAAWDAVHTPVIAWVVVLVAYTLGAAVAWVAVTKPFGRGADAVPARSAEAAVTDDVDAAAVAAAAVAIAAAAGAAGARAADAAADTEADPRAPAPAE